MCSSRFADMRGLRVAAALAMILIATTKVDAQDRVIWSDRPGVPLAVPISALTDAPSSEFEAARTDLAKRVERSRREDGKCIHARIVDPAPVVNRTPQAGDESVSERLAAAPVLVAGRVTALVPVWNLDSTTVETLVSVRVEDVLKAGVPAVATGDTVTYLQHSGVAFVNGARICTDNSPYLEAADRDLLLIGGWPDHSNPRHLAVTASDVFRIDGDEAEGVLPHGERVRLALDDLRRGLSAPSRPRYEKQ